MDFADFAGFPITDAHVHFMHLEQRDALLDVMETVPYTCINLLSFPHFAPDERYGSILPQAINFNPEAIYFKFCHPDRTYICGGLDYTEVLQNRARTPQLLANQIVTLQDIGFDGLKLVEGKPLWRQWIPFRLDGPEYEPMWATLEELGMPVLCHFGDPGFRELASTDTFSPHEMETVLSRHPDLRIAFAHFYFLTDDLVRARELLDIYPHVCFDLTPGSMLVGAPYGAALDHVALREFFFEYKDRVLYGSDTLSTNLNNEKGLGYALGRAWSVRCLLELERVPSLPEPPIFVPRLHSTVEGARGLNLPAEVLEKVYHLNFERLFGSEPALLNQNAALAELERLDAEVDAHGIGQNSARWVATQLKHRQV